MDTIINNKTKKNKIYRILTKDKKHFENIFNALKSFGYLFSYLGIDNFKDIEKLFKDNINYSGIFINVPFMEFREKNEGKMLLVDNNTSYLPIGKSEYFDITLDEFLSLPDELNHEVDHIEVGIEEIWKKAIVYKDKVQIGCQIFHKDWIDTIEKILDLSTISEYEKPYQNDTKHISINGADRSIDIFKNVLIINIFDSEYYNFSIKSFNIIKEAFKQLKNQ